MADALAALDARVRDLEAGLREAKAEIKFEAIKETQSIVNSVQGEIYREIRDVSVALDRLNRDVSPSPSPQGTLPLQNDERS